MEDLRQASSETSPATGGKQGEQAQQANEQAREERERALDKTVADSFPASDPPSSIPDPDDENAAA